MKKEKLNPEIESSLIEIIKEVEDSEDPNKVIIIGEDNLFFDKIKDYAGKNVVYDIEDLAYCFIYNHLNKLYIIYFAK